VLRVFEESARAVAAGTPLLEIGDPADLEVIVEVLSRDGAIIQPGMKVEFEQWGGGAPLNGVVRLVEPAAFTKVSALGVEEQRVNVVADFAEPPAERGNLGDQFRVEARIITWSDPDALKVPAGALFRQGNNWAAFVVVDGRASLRKVQAGQSSGTETQVLDGLKEGETVIIYPGSRIEEATRVQALQIER
jgi:HlyD family secretion protein